jgi:hypothetical protein
MVNTVCSKFFKIVTAIKTRLVSLYTLHKTWIFIIGTQYVKKYHKTTVTVADTSKLWDTPFKFFSHTKHEVTQKNTLSLFSNHQKRKYLKNTKAGHRMEVKTAPSSHAKQQSSGKAYEVRTYLYLHTHLALVSGLQLRIRTHPVQRGLRGTEVTQTACRGGRGWKGHAKGDR